LEEKCDKFEAEKKFIDGIRRVLVRDVDLDLEM
jgi:hypothetical protein